MALDEPIRVVGGSPPTLELLPKLGFRKPPAARHYVLPTTARGLAANLVRQLWWQGEHLARFVPNVGVHFSRRLGPSGATDVRMMDAEAELHMPAGQQGLVQIIEQWHWRWLLEMPQDLAIPIGLMFYRDGDPAGYSISQLEPGATGLDGRILHMQWLDHAIAPWLVHQTAEFLASHGAGFVRCRVSTPEKFAAVEAAGFRFSKPAPIHWYSRHIACPACVDVGYLRGDDAMPWAALRGRRLADKRHGYAPPAFAGNLRS
jgi:hypothetical protein